MPHRCSKDINHGISSCLGRHACNKLLYSCCERHDHCFVGQSQRTVQRPLPYLGYPHLRGWTFIHTSHPNQREPALVIVIKAATFCWCLYANVMHQGNVESDIFNSNLTTSQLKLAIDWERNIGDVSECKCPQTCTSMVVYNVGFISPNHTLLCVQLVCTCLINTIYFLGIRHILNFICKKKKTFSK